MTAQRTAGATSQKTQPQPVQAYSPPSLKPRDSKPAVSIARDSAVSHIRKPDTRRKFYTSSSGYVRRVPWTFPTPATYCGAPVTDRDVSRTEVKWSDCEACKQAVAS